jgi:hypothetical protein
MECFNTLCGSLCHICVPYFVMLSTAQLIMPYRYTDAPNVSLCVGHACFTQLHMQVTDMNQCSSNMLIFMNLQLKESPSTNSDLRLEVQSEKKLLTVKSWFTRFKCYIISVAFEVVHRLLPCCSTSTSPKASKVKRVWDTPLVQG